MNIPYAPDGEAPFRVRGSSWNAMREAATSGGRFSVAGPLELRNDAGGVTLVCTAGDGAPTPIIVTDVATDDAAGAGVFLGHIIDGPIDNEKTGDLGTEHFGIAPEEPGDGGGEGEGEEPPAPEEVELWNATGAALVVGGVVGGWHIGNRPDDMGGRRVFMVMYSPVAVTLKISGDETGGGKYAGKSYGSHPAGYTFSASGNLGDADLGTLSSTDDVLFFHLPEFGKSTHDITGDDGDLTPIATGTLIGYTDEDPPRKVVAGLSLTFGC